MVAGFPDGICCDRSGGPLGDLGSRHLWHHGDRLLVPPKSRQPKCVASSRSSEYHSLSAHREPRACAVQTKDDFLVMHLARALEAVAFVEGDR